jgi:hypothetical protein
MPMTTIEQLTLDKMRNLPSELQQQVSILQMLSYTSIDNEYQN